MSIFLNIQNKFVDSLANDTNIINNTTKSVFREFSKNVSSSNDVNSILMISIVFAIVSIALYISFKNPRKQKRTFRRRNV